MKLKLLFAICLLFCVNSSIAQKTIIRNVYWDRYEYNIAISSQYLLDGSTLHGAQKHYSKDGKLGGVQIYSFGKEISETNYFNDGSIAMHLTYIQKKDGNKTTNGSSKVYQISNQGQRYLVRECVMEGEMNNYTEVKIFQEPNVLSSHYRKLKDGSVHMTEYNNKGKMSKDFVLKNGVLKYYHLYDSNNELYLVIEDGKAKSCNLKNSSIEKIDSLRLKYRYTSDEESLEIEYRPIALSYNTPEELFEFKMGGWSDNSRCPIEVKYSIHSSPYTDNKEARHLDGIYKECVKGKHSIDALYSDGKVVWSNSYDEKNKLVKSLTSGNTETIDGHRYDSVYHVKSYVDGVLSMEEHYLEEVTQIKAWLGRDPYSKTLRTIQYKPNDCRAVVEYLFEEKFRKKDCPLACRETGYEQGRKLYSKIHMGDKGSANKDYPWITVYFERYDDQGVIIDGTDLQSKLDALIGERNKQEKRFLDFGSATSKNIYILSGMPEEEFTSTQIKGKNKNILLALQRVYAELLFNIKAHNHYVEQEVSPIMTNGNMVDKIAVSNQYIDRFTTLNNQVKRINRITERLKEVVNDPKKSRDLNKELKDCTLQTANEIFAKL